MADELNISNSMVTGSEQRKSVLKEKYKMPYIENTVGKLYQ